MFRELKRLIEKADELYAVGQDESRSEAAQDAAYKAHYEAVYQIADELTALAKIDRSTARKMALHNRGEILALLERAR